MTNYPSHRVTLRLAREGVSSKKILQSLTNFNLPLTASTEAKEVIKNINLFRLDAISTLEKAYAFRENSRARTYRAKI